MPEKEFQGFPKEPATNYWPYPKALNGFWHTLTGSEQKLLDYILRHTWGFKKDSDCISYTQFITGVKNLDKGCGIKSSATLSKALQGLEKKRFIQRKGGMTSGKVSEYTLSFLQKQGTLETKEVGGNTSLETKDPLFRIQRGTSLETKDHVLRTTTKDTIKDKPIMLQPKQESFFSDYISSLQGSKSRGNQIIGMYWLTKDWKFDNKDKANAALKRDLRAANNLKGYDKEEIQRTMKWLDANADYKWTLETVHKYIDEIGNIDEKSGVIIIKDLIKNG